MFYNQQQFRKMSVAELISLIEAMLDAIDRYPNTSFKDMCCGIPKKGELEVLLRLEYLRKKHHVKLVYQIFPPGEKVMDPKFYVMCHECGEWVPEHPQRLHDFWGCPRCLRKKFAIEHGGKRKRRT